MNRYLDTLLRNKQLFLLPLLVTPLMALLVMFSLAATYKVQALVWTEPNTALDQTRVDRGTLTANQREAQAVREWLESETFRREVMDQVGLTSAIMRGQWPVPSRLSLELDRIGLTSIYSVRRVLKFAGVVPPETTDEALGQGMNMVRKTLSVTAEGQNLLRITYTGSEPAVGQRMVEQVMHLYRDRVLSSRIQQAQMRIDFYNRQLQLQGERLQQANEQYREFLEAHPAPIAGQARPATEEAALDDLRRAYLLEQTLYESYVRRLDDVRVESEAAISNHEMTFQVIDQPQQPQVAGVSGTTIGSTVVIGVFLGAVLGLLPIVALTAMDGTVRTAGDIEQIVRPPLVARAPLVPVRGRQGEAVRGVLARGVGLYAPQSPASSNGRENGREKI